MGVPPTRGIDAAAPVVVADPSDWRDHRLAIICDPRFPGGTSTGVAAEIRALAGNFRLSVVAVETAMFEGRSVHPAIEAALQDHGLELAWNPDLVRADTIVFHNPSCLRHDSGLPMRLSAARAFVVTHENFLLPNGIEGHDVAGCLDRIAAALVCGERRLAPVSPYNRATVTAWLAGGRRDWVLAAEDWPAVVDLPLEPPTRAPRDRRGRHSRPGLEKFPAMAEMLAHFPSHAEGCVILGGDRFLADPDTLPGHWQVFGFGEIEVAAFLRDIDFFVYFTNPNWRESFGRAIAEAVAAGKLVITDAGTAQAFPGAVVASDGSDVDAIVRRYVVDAHAYVRFVEAAQASLAAFGPAALAARAKALIRATGGVDALV